MLNSTIPFGIGTDIVDILRFKTKPLKNNQNFYKKIFSDSEINIAKNFIHLTNILQENLLLKNQLSKQYLKKSLSLIFVLLTQKINLKFY